MRIFLIQRFDLASVSCARRVLCQTEELLRRGHEVVLTDFVHTQRQRELPLVANLSSLGAQIIPVNRQMTHFFSNYHRLAAMPNKPNIVHLWKSYPDASLLAYFLAKRWRVPLHYDWDDWEKGIAGELTQSRLVRWVAARWDRLFPSLCHTISVASGFLRENALHLGTDPARMWDAPVGADIEQFSPRPPDQALLEQLGLRQPILVYAGQLEVASYAEQTLDVLRLVRADHPSASLLVLGGGRKLPAIRERAQSLGLGGGIHFTDYVPGDAIPRYLSLAQVALAPFEENDVTRAKSPLKIAEYLAMGLPVVASDVGETRPMIGEAGAVVPCGDTEGIAREVLRILASPERQAQMRLAGRHTAETRYNWKTHVDALEEAYRYAIAHF